MRQYKRMTYQIRMQIETLYNLSGLCATEIARVLGYHHTSVLAELKRGFYMHRNGDWTETKRYSADIAQRKADFEKSAKGATMKIGTDHEFVRIIEDLILRRHLSPAAALATIRRENIQTKTKVCVTTLYHYIDKGVFLHVTNKDLVCRGERKRKYRRVKKAKTPPRGRSIDIRPPHILARDEFGHWELDSVIGTNEKGNTLLVMTERKTRFQLIFRSKDKTAASTVVMLDRLEKRLGVGKFRKIFRTITCDNGCEFADWRRMELSRRVLKLERFTLDNSQQLLNIPTILVTFDVSKLLRFKEVSCLQALNISDMSVTRLVSKPLKLRLVIACISRNVLFMLVTLLVLKWERFRTESLMHAKKV